MRLLSIEVRKRISKQGLSVAQFANSVGIQPETLFANMRDKKRRIRWDTLWRISQALGVEPEVIAEMREWVVENADDELD